jgi:hypothetical protein
MRRLILLAIALLTACTFIPASSHPTVPLNATLALGVNPFCVATRVGPTLAITARHCVDDGLCTTATDYTGHSVRCSVELLAPGARDLAYIRLAPGSNADIASVGRFQPGTVTTVSNKPLFATHRDVEATYAEPELIGGGPSGPIIIDHLITFDGLYVRGESGGGVFQNGRLVFEAGVMAHPGSGHFGRCSRNRWRVGAEKRCSCKRSSSNTGSST